MRVTAGKRPKSIGQENLTKPDLLAKITACQQALLAKNLITVDNVIQEFGRLAFFDVRDLFAPDGSLLPIHKLSRDAAAAIAGFELVQVQIPRSLLRGIRLLGRLEGIYLLGCRGGINCGLTRGSAGTSSDGRVISLIVLCGGVLIVFIAITSANNSRTPDAALPGNISPKVSATASEPEAAAVPEAPEELPPIDINASALFYDY